LKLRDSGIRKQAITGRRKRVGKDFRHRRGLRRKMNPRAYVFIKRSDQEGGCRLNYGKVAQRQLRTAAERSPPVFVEPPAEECDNVLMLSGQIRHETGTHPVDTAPCLT